MRASDAEIETTAVAEARQSDRRLARIVRRCQQLPGQLLFQYVDDDGGRHPVTSDLVNDYLKQAMGAAFTAKDFRTWGATLRAFALLAATPSPEEATERAYKACELAVVRAVAADLRNTPAVCRKSYINPVVFTAWRSGALHRALEGSLARAPRRAEAAALRLLRAEVRGARGGAVKSKARRRPTVAVEGASAASR